MNGDDVNSKYDQCPSRSIINFINRSIQEASAYPLPFEIVERLVKPARFAQKNERAKQYWWRYYRHNYGCYSTIESLGHCFIAAATTKYLNFSAAPTNYIFLNTLFIFTTDRWDLFAVVQCTLHEVWARKYSGALKQDLRYSPSNCFETFPFPDGLWQTANPNLAILGEQYHEHRRTLMQSLRLGLTSIYNLFHTQDLTMEQVAKVSKQPPAQAEAGYQRILELRRLHRDLDNAVRDAYGWSDLDLGHDFVDVETLPENDRRRCTISPAARRELLRRLLALNLRRSADTDGKKPAYRRSTRKSKPADDSQLSLFDH